MNWKRLILASIAVVLGYVVLDYLLHCLLLRGSYEAISYLWRPNMLQKMWAMGAVYLVTAPLFVYIFAKGYEDKGWMEGVRFGLVIGLFMSVPMSLGTYFMIAIPYTLAVKWFAVGMVEWVILGLLVSLIYRPKGVPLPG
jgi:hypothetical protein